MYLGYMWTGYNDIFRIYVNTHIYATTIKEYETMNLKEIKWGGWKDLEGGKGKGEMIYLDYYLKKLKKIKYIFFINNLSSKQQLIYFLNL